MKNKKGFTLIELIIVIAIISILAMMGVNSYLGSLQSSRDARRKADLKSIQTALELYNQTNGTYPTTSVVSGGWRSSSAGGAWIPELTSNYISVLPKDPINNGPSDPTNNPNNNYAYFYYSGSTVCNQSPGTYYILVANLERTSDPIVNPPSPIVFDNASSPGTACNWPPSSPLPGWAAHAIIVRNP